MLRGTYRVVGIGTVEKYCENCGLQMMKGSVYLDIGNDVMAVCARCAKKHASMVTIFKVKSKLFEQRRSL